MHCTMTTFTVKTMYFKFFSGNALDDLHLDEPLGLGIDRDFDTDSPTISNSISAGLASSGEF